MEVSHIREELHQLIDIADERLINLMYAMMHADMKEEDYQLPNDHKKIIEQRLSLHNNDPNAGFDWTESKKRILNQL